MSSRASGSSASSCSRASRTTWAASPAGYPLRASMPRSWRARAGIGRPRVAAIRFSTSRRAAAISSWGPSESTAARTSPSATPRWRSSVASALRARPLLWCLLSTHALAKAASSMRPTSANRASTDSAISCGTRRRRNAAASCARVRGALVSSFRQAARAASSPPNHSFSAVPPGAVPPWRSGLPESPCASQSRTASSSPAHSSAAAMSVPSGTTISSGGAQPSAASSSPSHPLTAPPRAPRSPDRFLVPVLVCLPGLALPGTVLRAVLSRAARGPCRLAGRPGASRNGGRGRRHAGDRPQARACRRLPVRRLRVQARADAQLFLDLLLDLVGHIGVVVQEGPCVLLALPELVALVGVPGAGLAHDRLLDPKIDQAALPADPDSEQDVELSGLEGGRHLVLDYLHPGPAAHRIGAVLERLDPAYVEPDRRVELQRPAAGGGLRAPEHDADLLPQLVDEDRGGLGLVQRARQLAQGLGHEPGLQAYVAVPHLALDLGPGHQGRDRVDDDDVDRAGADQHVRDLQCLLTGVGL